MSRTGNFTFGDVVVPMDVALVDEWREAAPKVAMALAEVGYKPCTVLVCPCGCGATNIDAGRPDLLDVEQVPDFVRAAEIAGAPGVAAMYRRIEAKLVERWVA